MSSGFGEKKGLWGFSFSRAHKTSLGPSYFVFTAKETVLSQDVTEITSSGLSDAS